ncbi:hypothetical protein HKW74_28040 [Pseudomonas aeruginosa]|nr:hypothetical protein [Pseudomonas aeruginosa]
MEPVLFYGVPHGCSFGSIVALEWLGRPYRLCRIEMPLETGERTYVRLNPARQTPTLLLEDGRALSESLAILQHLAARDLCRKLGYPQGSAEFDELNFALALLHTECHSAWGALFYLEDADATTTARALTRAARAYGRIDKLLGDGRPAWAAEPFECLLFDVAGLTLAVPLVCLGSIYPLENQELTPLFGQPDWFLGILPSQAGNLKVLDTARWVMPERYRDDYRDGLKYVISVQGYEWGLAVHQVSRSIRLDPAEVKWRSQRSQRPWLAGTVIEHMCALLDVAALAELIASGAVKRLHGDH